MRPLATTLSLCVFLIASASASADICDTASLADLRAVEHSSNNINRGGRLLHKILKSNSESYAQFKQSASQSGLDVDTVIKAVPIKASWRQSDSEMEAHWSEVRRLLFNKLEQSYYETVEETRDRSDLSQYATAMIAECAGKRALHFWKSYEVENAVMFTFYYDQRRNEGDYVLDSFSMAPEGLWDCTKDVSQKLKKVVTTTRQDIKCARNAGVQDQGVIFTVRVVGDKDSADASARMAPVPPPGCQEEVQTKYDACPVPGQKGRLVLERVTCQGGVEGENEKSTKDLCGPASCLPATEVAYWAWSKMFGVGDIQNDPRFTKYIKDRSSPEVQAIRNQLVGGATIVSIYKGIIVSDDYRNRWFQGDASTRYTNGEGSAYYAVSGLFSSIFGPSYVVAGDAQDRSNEVAAMCGGSVCLAGWREIALKILDTRYTAAALDRKEERVLPYHEIDPGNRIAYCGPVSDFMEAHPELK